jgi:hypothetical protein
MRSAVVLGLLLCLVRVVHADGPIRIAVECEDSGRTKACPAFLLGFIDANKVLLTAPRAYADVVLYATAQQIALVDRVHLRFVGSVVHAPPVIETDVDIDTRADDDAQRAQLEAGFLRGMALYVAVRYPKLVTVTFGAPDGHEVVQPETTPWGFALSLGGYGNRTGAYRSYSGWSNVELSRVTRETRSSLSVGASGGVSKQPEVDGVKLDSKQWALSSNIEGAWLVDDHWSFGAASSVTREDPYAQRRHSWNARGGVEWDKYAANDPRGNRLAVLYYAGYQVERYNLRNELLQTFAHYPIHALVASGTLRKDKVGIGLSLSVGGELLHPGRRNHISASPFIEWQLGDHIDLNVSLSFTQRALPGPDPTLVDESNYQLISRLSYAEPRSMNGSLHLTFHWDRTNGARNDRVTDI